MDSKFRALSRLSTSGGRAFVQCFRSALSWAVLLWLFSAGLNLSLCANQAFLVTGMDNQTFKKQFKGGLYKVPSQSKNGINTNNRYAKKEIAFQSWDKHFSSLGQKKMYPEKSKPSTFNRQFKKEIRAKKEFDLTIANWNQQLAKIRKDARIDLSDEAHILGNREAYQLILQEQQFFRDMAENMDLRSINRYQFRSNRPEGPIPVDSVSDAKAAAQ